MGRYKAGLMNLTSTIVTMLLPIILLSFGVLVEGDFPFFLKPQYYTNGDELSLGMAPNENALPCDNFYEYACGNWIRTTSKPKYQPFWNPWQVAAQRISHRIKNILQARDPSPTYLRKAQKMYGACITDRNSISDLKSVICNLGGWSFSNQTSNFNWIQQVAAITRTFGIYPLLKMHVFINMFNTSRYVLYIENGDLILPRDILVEQKHRKYLRIYYKWILKVVKYLYPNSENVEANVLDIINFEVKIAKLYDQEKTEELSVDQLTQDFPVEWRSVFNNLFTATSVNIQKEDKILLRCRKYLTSLIVLISNTKSETVGNYLIWSVIQNLSRDTTKVLRKLDFAMDKAVFKLNEDVPRSEECIHSVVSYTEIAIAARYFEMFIPTAALSAVESLIENIKRAFIVLLKDSWLSESTRNLAILKIKNLNYEIAYPAWFYNETILKDYFLEVNISDNHFMNMLQLKDYKMKNQIEKLNKVVTWEYPSSILEVNAYYSILQNSIFLPLGLIQPPFFDINKNSVYNYGALGSLIGHEMAHALDTLGRRADKDGNIKNWWLEDDVIKYNTMMSCFEQQYNRYNISGSDTLAENIADNVGLKISFDAYKRSDYFDDNLKQLFFIQFSQLWCEITEDNEFIDEENHAPVTARVMGTLYNNDDFNKVFKCNEHDHKCSLW